MGFHLPLIVRYTVVAMLAISDSNDVLEAACLVLGLSACCELFPVVW